MIDLVQVSSEFGDQAELETASALEHAGEPAEPLDYAALIKDAIGDDLQVYIIGKTVFLEGYTADEYRRERAVAIAQAFGMPVVDLLRITEPPVAEAGFGPDWGSSGSSGSQQGQSVSQQGLELKRKHWRWRRMRQMRLERTGPPLPGHQCPNRL